MRLNLDTTMKKLLKEIVSNATEIAEKAKDKELFDEYVRLDKIISQSSYRKYSKDDMESIWNIADVGQKTCEILLTSATSQEQFEKTGEVISIYRNIKQQIDEELSKKLTKKR